MIQEIRVSNVLQRACFTLRGKRSACGLSILASGSSGNITLLETEHTRLLVDAGLGKRETLARLAAIE